jgi:hypothetical protein
MPDLEAVRSLYPAPPPPSAVTRRRARLALVGHMGGRRRRRLGRRVLIPAAGLACLAAAAAVALVGVGEEGVVDARAAEVLRDAAANTRQQKPVPPGLALYTKSVDAYMSTSAEAGFSVLVPHVREIWAEHERSVLRRTSGEPKFLSARDRARWIAAGRPDIREGGPHTSVIPTDEPSKLPTDVQALFAVIKDEAEGHSEGTYRQMFTRVGDYLREASDVSMRSFTLEQRAALYEVAAMIPGIEMVGTVRDPAGRRGIAVAMEQRSDGVRHTLVIDPVSGALLAEEEVTLEDNFYGYPAGTVVGHSTLAVERIVRVPSSRPAWARPR